MTSLLKKGQTALMTKGKRKLRHTGKGPNSKLQTGIQIRAYKHTHTHTHSLHKYTTYTQQHASQARGPLLWHTLSSFSHFSSSCLRPCCRTGLHSSRDSNLLSWPWSSRIPKYWSRARAWPGCA